MNLNADLDLDLIRARNVVRREYREATTPGVWESHANAGYAGIMACDPRGKLTPLLAADGCKVADGAWIGFAHADDAVETIDALLAEVERLRAACNDSTED